MDKKNKYGFLTALSMVIGIVIGSGIFFKADDILMATGGDVALGILAFLLVGSGVLFGALVITEYAILDSSDGGLITYSKRAFSQKTAFYISWFMIAVYFPAMIVLFGFVNSIYLGQLIGVNSLKFTVVATFMILFIAFLSNILSKRVGGLVQNLSTIIKLIPLVIIAVFGILFFDQSVATTTISNEIMNNKNVLDILIAIAFSYEGWVVVTSISGETKNAKKTLPKALAFGVILVTIIYILYFYGITKIIAPADIINLGDAHTSVAATKVLGNIGGKILTLFIVISVYGALNGMVLAYLRLPKAVVEKKLMKNVFEIDSEKTKANFSKGTILFCGFWVFIIYVFQMLIVSGVIFSNLEVAFDLSAMPIVVMYMIYIALYLKVFKVTGKKDFKLKVYSFIAILVSLIVIYGAMSVNGFLYICISLLVTALGIFFIKK